MYDLVSSFPNILLSPEDASVGRPTDWRAADWLVVIFIMRVPLYFIMTQQSGLKRYPRFLYSSSGLILISISPMKKIEAKKIKLQQTWGSVDTLALRGVFFSRFSSSNFALKRS